VNPRVAVALTSIGLAILSLALVATAYVVASWHLGRRGGSRGLLITWIVSALLFAAYTTFQIHRRQADLGFPPERQHDAAFFFGTLGIGALCFGAASLTLRRRLRSGATHLGLRGTLAGLGAYLGVLTAVFLVVLVTDVVGLLRRI
jgi:hypothetical protein